MTSPDYQVVIIGGGPAGLTAGLYTSRNRLESLLLEKGFLGGQIVNAEEVDNYPGFPEGISGAELGAKLQEHAVKYGLKTEYTEVTGLELKGDLKVVKTPTANYTARTVIVCAGSDRLKLSVPGEAEYLGRGVSYCATCDGAFFRDRSVAIVGGGNSAVVEALQLAKIATKVVIIHRRDQLRAAKITQERALAEPKISFAWNTVVDEIKGNEFVRALKLSNVTNGQKSEIEVDGVFVAVGQKPNSDYLKGIVPLDELGYIVTNDRMETGVAGIYAAGDIRHDSGRQSVIAAGDGATAAVYAGRYIG